MSGPKVPRLDVHAPDGQRVMLYRFYDESGQLLYVGITDSPRSRWSDHKKTKADTWWPQFRVVHTEWYPDRAAAEAAEIRAIRTEWPLHNGTHNPAIRDGRRSSAMYLHPMARKHFGDKPFTCMDVEEQLGLSYSTVRVYAQRLVAKGSFRRAGKEPGTHRKLFIAVDGASLADASPVKAPLLQLAQNE